VALIRYNMSYTGKIIGIGPKTVSVPERGFVALILARRRLATLKGREAVSVPERGFVALIPS
jgi:hypothetical protein